jgi:hypothetical protein
LYFKIIWPKENNRPIGEDSPNLVTLLASHKNLLPRDRSEGSALVDRVTRYWADFRLFGYFVFFGQSFSILEVNHFFGILFYHGKSDAAMGTKMGWATFWAIFSSSRPAF